LFEQALERFAEELGRRGFLRLLEPGVTLEHIRAIFDDRIEALCGDDSGRGCLLCHTAMELAPRDAEIQGVLQKFIKRASKTFSAGLETAQRNGAVRSDLDTRSAGQFLTGAMFGLTVLARCGFDRQALDAFVDNTLAGLSA
jgi:AcrR family transcriptional regulator